MCDSRLLIRPSFTSLMISSIKILCFPFLILAYQLSFKKQMLRKSNVYHTIMAVLIQADFQKLEKPLPPQGMPGKERLYQLTVIRNLLQSRK